MVDNYSTLQFNVMVHAGKKSGDGGGGGGGGGGGRGRRRSCQCLVGVWRPELADLPCVIRTGRHEGPLRSCTEHESNFY